jgi:hypothetical protein
MNEKLTGGELIPDFSIPVADLFQDIVSDEDTLRLKLVRQIEEVFADTPFPGDENISPYEYEIHVELFRGRHWKDIPLETIFRERGELSFFTPEAYRFFLPAFMRATLLHYIEMDTLSGNLISHLSPKHGDSDSGLHNLFIRMNNGFSRTEQKAILAFLESYLQLFPEEYSVEDRVYRPMLDRAIEYWKERLEANP